MHIEVEDVDMSAEFYRTLFQITKEVKWHDGSARALIFPDGTAFGIWQRGKRGLYDGEGAQHLHFALQIEPAEIDKYRERLQELGVKVIDHDWEDGHRSLYFFDRDGHQGELMTKDWLGRPKSRS